MTDMTAEPWDIYARLSLDKAGEGTKVATQVADCKGYITTVLGGRVGNVYVDNDISATNGKTRPDFEKLLRSKTKRLVVWHQDRLLRVSKDLERVLDLGCIVHQVTAGSLDLATPTGRAIARTIAAWSTYEGEHKAERQQAQHRKNRAAGVSWWTRRPFGYEMDLSHRPAEAQALKAAYKALISGTSSYAIAKGWNEAGLRQDNGNVWEGRRITQLLGNVRNIGKATYHEEIVGEGKWEPIIDEGSFYAARAILTDPKRRKGGAPKYSLLSGPMKCGRCSTDEVQVPMNRWKGLNSNKRPFDRYRCNKCQYMVDAKWAERLVTVKVLNYLEDNAFQWVTSGEDDVKTEIELSALLKRKDDISEAYARGDVELSQLMKATDSIQKRIEELQAILAKAAKKAVNMSYDDAADLWKNRTIDQRRELISDNFTIYAHGAHPNKRLDFVEKPIDPAMVQRMP